MIGIYAVLVGMTRAGIAVGDNILTCDESHDYEPVEDQLSCYK